jgi:cytochrome c551/c552
MQAAATAITAMASAARRSEPERVVRQVDVDMVGPSLS